MTYYAVVTSGYDVMVSVDEVFRGREKAQNRMKSLAESYMDQLILDGDGKSWSDFEHQINENNAYVMAGDSTVYYNVCEIDVPVFGGGETVVDIVRDGVTGFTTFQNILPGDYIVNLGVTAADNAHQSGDSDYDGWLFYDTQGNGWFPEDTEDLS